jgi:hypothetical protein
MSTVLSEDGTRIAFDKARWDGRLEFGAITQVEGPQINAD